MSRMNSNTIQKKVHKKLVKVLTEVLPEIDWDRKVTFIVTAIVESEDERGEGYKGMCMLVDPDVDQDNGMVVSHECGGVTSLAGRLAHQRVSEIVHECVGEAQKMGGISDMVSDLMGAKH